MWDVRYVHRILARRPERKRLVGKPRSRWKDNIRMDLLRNMFRKCQTCKKSIMLVEGYLALNSSCLLKINLEGTIMFCDVTIHRTRGIRGFGPVLHPKRLKSNVAILICFSSETISSFICIISMLYRFLIAYGYNYTI